MFNMHKLGQYVFIITANINRNVYKKRQNIRTEKCISFTFVLQSFCPKNVVVCLVYRAWCLWRLWLPPVEAALVQEDGDSEDGAQHACYGDHQAQGLTPGGRSRLDVLHGAGVQVQLNLPAIFVHNLLLVIRQRKLVLRCHLSIPRQRLLCSWICQRKINV